MSAPRTYWHLQQLGRKPKEYDIVTSELLYYVKRGLEVKASAHEWLEKYQRGSRFDCENWEAFRDPRETTYTSYMQVQKTKEIYVDGLLESIGSSDYDAKLPEAWVQVLGRVLAPMRYPVHGLQMVAAYVGQMAPSGRITITSMFQAADEMRRVQRLAYRMRQLQLTHSDFGAESKAAWETDPLWQPLREVLEQLLVTYDWGESLVGLNLVVKPIFDELFSKHFADLAESSGDATLARILASLYEDNAWQRQWTQALIRMAVEDRPDNAAVVRGWLDRWHPRMRQAVAPWGAVFEAVSASPKPDFATVQSQLDSMCEAYWISCGVSSADSKPH